MSTSPGAVRRPAASEDAALQALDRLDLLTHHFACMATANDEVIEHPFTADHARTVAAVLQESVEAITANRNALIVQQRTWALQHPELLEDGGRRRSAS